MTDNIIQIHGSKFNSTISFPTVEKITKTITYDLNSQMAGSLTLSDLIEFTQKLISDLVPTDSRVVLANGNLKVTHTK